MNINSLRQSISDIIVAPADRRDRTKTRGGPLAFFRSVDITLSSLTFATLFLFFVAAVHKERDRAKWQY